MTASNCCWSSRGTMNDGAIIDDKLLLVSSNAANASNSSRLNTGCWVTTSIAFSSELPDALVKMAFRSFIARDDSSIDSNLDRVSRSNDNDDDDDDDNDATVSSFTRAGSRPRKSIISLDSNSDLLFFSLRSSSSTS